MMVKWSQANRFANALVAGHSGNAKSRSLQSKEATAYTWREKVNHCKCTLLISAGTFSQLILFNKNG